MINSFKEKLFYKFTKKYWKLINQKHGILNNFIVQKGLFKDLKLNKEQYWNSGDLGAKIYGFYEKDIQEMAPEFHYEPLIGLASGKDGLESVKIILEEAYKYMTDLGLLIVEVGNSRNALERNFPHLPFIWIDFECGGE